MAQLEVNCARLKRQLKDWQLEAQKWKDACVRLEKQLKELQASRSPSTSKVCMYHLNKLIFTRQKNSFKYKSFKDAFQNVPDINFEDGCY